METHSIAPLRFPIVVALVAVLELLGVLPFAPRYAYLLSGVAFGFGIFAVPQVLSLRSTERANLRDTMFAGDLPQDIARARAWVERRRRARQRL